MDNHCLSLPAARCRHTHQCSSCWLQQQALAILQGSSCARILQAAPVAGKLVTCSANLLVDEFTCSANMPPGSAVQTPGSLKCCASCHRQPRRIPPQVYLLYTECPFTHTAKSQTCDQGRCCSTNPKAYERPVCFRPRCSNMLLYTMTPGIQCGRGNTARPAHLTPSA